MFMLTWAGILIILLPPLSLAGVLLLVWGLRGRVEFSGPTCKACGYDLRGLDFTHDDRACPECGADLAARRAVRFGRAPKRPVAIVLGSLLLLPAVLLSIAMVGWTVVASTAGPAHTQSTPQLARSANNTELIALAGRTADEPWAWQEIERRYQAGRFAPAEVEAAMDEFITHLEAQHTARAAGANNRPLGWAQSLVQSLMHDGVISDTQYARLAEAYYGPEPAIELRDRARRGEELRFTVQWSRHWNLPDVQVIKALREVRHNSGTIAIHHQGGAANHHPDRLSAQGPFQITGLMPLDLPAGEHELIFVVDAGVVPQNTPFAGRDGTPGQRARWVNPVHTWTYELPVTIRVQDGPTVELVTDLSQYELTAGMLGVDQALVREASQGAQLVVAINSVDALPMPLSFRVSAQWLDGERVRLGTYHRLRAGHASTSLQANLPQGLPPDVTSLRLIFEPDPEAVEATAEYDRIWGQTHIIDDVELQRYDLVE